MVSELVERLMKVDVTEVFSPPRVITQASKFGLEAAAERAARFSAADVPAAERAARVAAAPPRQRVAGLDDALV